MGCAGSIEGPGPAHEDLKALPAPTAEELRLHRDIDNMDFYSDALTADEPSNFSLAVSMKARLLVSRVSHGINDEPDQFEQEVLASIPVYLPEDFDFVREWVDEFREALAGQPPAPIVETLLKTPTEATSASSTHCPDSSRTIAAQMSKPAHVRNPNSPQNQLQQSQNRKMLPAAATTGDIGVSSPLGRSTTTFAEETTDAHSPPTRSPSCVDVGPAASPPPLLSSSANRVKDPQGGMGLQSPATKYVTSPATVSGGVECDSHEGVATLMAKNRQAAAGASDRDEDGSDAQPGVPVAD